MNWDNARYLLAIARTGSVRAAAISLRVDQATVARRLRTLENELRLRLFHRGPEGYSLTDAGKQLLPDAEIMEAAAAALERKSTGMDASLSGIVHIASTETLARYFLLPALSHLRQSHPEITVILSTAPALVDIGRGEADIAVRSSRPADENLIIRRLSTFHLGLYASADYVSRYGHPVDGSDFSGHNLIMFPRNNVPHYWQKLCGEPVTKGTVVLETPSQWMLIEAIRQGMGISMMATEIVERGFPELINIMPTRQDECDIWLVINPEVWPAGRVRIVAEAISQAFSTPMI